MNLWIRALYRSQPAWLRRLEVKALARGLARPLDPARATLPGDVVVVGFLGTASGLGESARHMLRRIRAAGVTAHGANVSRFAAMEDFDAGPLWPEQAAPGGLAILHVNPDILNLVLAAIGRRRLRSRHVVGYWFWELDVLPPKWIRALRCVDEIWAPSRFIADAVAKALPGRAVHVLPLPFDAASQPMVPRRDPLPQFQGRPVVLFAYDVRSTLARKNPEAVVEAFRRATEGDANPVLVLKANNESAWPGARDHLERAIAGMPNVHVIRDVMSEDGIKDLIARADVVMSLHRAEGFGLLLAEAMAAAKPVIATDWSGSRDFMSPECSVLVPCKLVPVCDPQRIYDKYEANWAEPDIAFAAEALRRLLRDPSERQRLGAAARSHVLAFFAPENWIKTLPDVFWRTLTDAAKGRSED